MQGRLILVHLMCRAPAPFQTTENVDEDKATGILHFPFLLVNVNACTNQLGKKGVTI